MAKFFTDSKIYEDTVEIVKVAVGCSSDKNALVGQSESTLKSYIKAVFETLNEINEKLED